MRRVLFLSSGLRFVPLLPPLLFWPVLALSGAGCAAASSDSGDSDLAATSVDAGGQDGPGGAADTDAATDLGAPGDLAVVDAARVKATDLAVADLARPPDLDHTDLAVCHAFLNEIVTGTTAQPNGTSEEFIEIVNPCPAAADLSGSVLVYRSERGSHDVNLVRLDGLRIPAGGFGVCAQKAYSGPADLRYGGALAASGGGLAILDDAGQVVDSVGWGSAMNGFERTHAAPAPALGASIGRIPDGANTDDNAKDFRATAAPTPGRANH
jgi:hypothetical protein